MNTDTTSNAGFMLLFRGTGWHKDLSPEQIQTVMSQWSAWFNRLTAEGILKAGQPLESESKLVVGRGRTVSDGPFVESKEAIGGYFLLDVHSFDEAVAIAQECPALDRGITVEVRPIGQQCPYTKHLESTSARELVAAEA